MYEYNLALRFERIAGHSPSKVALLFAANDTTTYAALNLLSNRIARFLQNQGVSRGHVVCISGTKSVRAFACMIACLKIGAPYSIMDPDSPVERLRKILATCAPRLLWGEHAFLQKLGDVPRELNVVAVASDATSLGQRLERCPGGNLPETSLVTGANPAYIMFTSGSTGFPKGAVMTHANVLNLIDWSRETYDLQPDDLLTNANPLYFDNSVFDFYSALFTGATLVPFSKEEVRDPQLLVGKVDALRCTLWFSVPSLLIFLQTMRATDGRHLRSIRRFVFGGEGYPKAKLKQLFDAYGDSSRFFNVYGPTECTCICSSYEVTADDFRNLQGLPPLGKIAKNFDYLILDPAAKPVPPGETGELCLLGPNVGQGYYNDPARTAGVFVQNPCHNLFRDILYKTGDLARLNPEDGKLYIQGRKDNQIKHMGYRIELEEIEAALHCLDYVSEAAALHASVNGLSRLVAVVSTSATLTQDRLREDLGRIIPKYMLPSEFHFESMLPKNPNGKVDRRRLAEKYLPTPLEKSL